MQKLDRTTLADCDEASHIHLENDGSLRLSGTASKKSGLQGFWVSLIEAHRYVQNRRSAALYN